MEEDGSIKEQYEIDKSETAWNDFRTYFPTVSWDMSTVPMILKRSAAFFRDVLTLILVLLSLTS